MKILVLNAGSSSLKYTVFEGTDLKVLTKGVVEKIGDTSGQIIHQYLLNGKVEKLLLKESVADHHEALVRIGSILTNRDYGVITDITEISAIGHRVVHGGEYFSAPRLIDEDLKAKVEELKTLAPLHNPPNL